MSERSHIEQVQRLFDTWATNGRADGMESGHVPMARPAFERLSLSAGQRYLDIGCGNGYTVRWAAENEAVDAVGLDVSGEMIRYARKLSADLPNTRFINAPFPLPILKPKSFDAVFSMEVFYYLTDLPWALVHVFRLLKPGGLFACVVDFYTENPASADWSETIGIPLNRLSKSQWSAAMVQAGFDVVEQVQLAAPSVPNAPDDWRQTVGSLLTLVKRPTELTV